MIQRLAHLCFVTNQYNPMVNFYKNILGLPVKFNFHQDNGKEFGVYFALGNMSFLEIFDIQGSSEKWGGQPYEVSQKEAIHYQHFCLEVTELEKYADELREKGIEVTPVTMGMDHSKQAWIKARMAIALNSWNIPHKAGSYDLFKVVSIISILIFHQHNLGLGSHFYS